MTNGVYDRACPKFEAALKLTPEHVRTAISLGQCEDKWGKLAGALGRFLDAKRLAVKQSSMDKVAEIDALVTELRPRVPLLRIIVRDDIARLGGLTILRGSTPVPALEWGLAVAIDPGSYNVSALANDKPRWAIIVDVPAGKTIDVVISPPWNVASPSSGAPSSTAAKTPNDSFFSKPLAWVGVGVTVTGLALGVGGGVGMVVSEDKANNHAQEIANFAATDPATGFGAVNPCASPGYDLAGYEAACDTVRSDIADYKSNQILTIVGASVFGVGAIATVIYYVQHRASRPTPSSAMPRRQGVAAVMPTISSSYRGIGVVGTF
jgi:hypothetical protein